MRTIKFRYYDIVEKKIVNWDDICDDFSIFVLDESSFAQREFIWMQYTGLKDKNGMEIYEGDVVNVNHYSGTPRLEKVHFYVSAGFSGLHPFTDSGHHWSANNCEVIGNIYENPELLEA